MKFMKIMSFLLSILLFTSCSSQPSEPTGDQKTVNDIAVQIIRCFDEKDLSGLSALMSKSAHDSYYIETQIKEAFEFYEGKSEKYIVTGWQWEGGIKDHKFTDKYFDPTINHIVTTQGKEYRISFTYYELENEHPEYIGITHIGLTEINKEDSIVLAWIGSDISRLYENGREMPFTRNPEYTNAVKPKE